MNVRRFIYRVLKFAMNISTLLMIYKGLMVVTRSEHPIAVVLREGMEPALYNGDLLFLTNYQEDPIRTGEIIVFKLEGKEIPNVSRVIKVHERQNGTSKFLTKGDNNQVDDRGLYPPGQLWLTRKDVVGRAKGYVPYVGMVTILLNDYPKLKYPALVGLYFLIRRLCKYWASFILHFIPLDVDFDLN
uniref:Signal peptidase complex catalytic subunit SEC11 n=1 Tax=Plectus sambesii TaxID=2011161 RepID=A0A914W201_9BILA